jgi:hypothetical protein
LKICEKNHQNTKVSYGGCRLYVCVSVKLKRKIKKIQENCAGKMQTTPTTNDDNDSANKPAAAATTVNQMDTLVTPADELLQWKDMPKHLQFNPYVITGYRPLQTFKGCLNSLFYMHNETINILTHGKYKYINPSYIYGTYVSFHSRRLFRYENNS